MTGKIKLVHSGGNSVSIAVPTSNPSSSEVAFKLPNADGSANQVIKTDGSGNLAFTTITDTDTVGISHLNVRYLTSSFQGSADPVTNWAKYDLDYNTAGFGADMTESSGIWTFPTTGYWEICCQAYFFGGGSGYGSAQSTAMDAVFSIDSGSNYDTSNRFSYTNVPGTSGYWYSQSINYFYFDVTDTSTHKMKVRVHSGPHTDAGGTFVRFKRLADT